MIPMQNIHWSRTLFLIGYQIFTLIYAPYYFLYYSPSWGLVATGVTLFILCGLGITTGYHRYFSHRCFKAHPAVEAVLLFLGSLGLQGSVIRWSYDHRLHHAHVDTDLDPYSIKKGFMYAHCLWLFSKPSPVEKKVVSDLFAKPLLRSQHEYDVAWMVGCNLVICLLAGFLFGDYWGAFFLLFFVRLFFQHHTTWFINSLAHTWGDKPFSQEHSAVNNYIISFLTFGEGYHNYHHTYANDYRNGVKWYQFDPTKWIIWTLSRLGLAWQLRTVDECTIRKKLVLEGKNELMDRLADLWYVKKEEIESRVQELSDRMMGQINQLQELKSTYLSQKSANSCKNTLKKLKYEMKEVNKQFKQEWRLFRRFSKKVYKLAPL